jgi:hypothetical protein
MATLRQVKKLVAVGKALRARFPGADFDGCLMFLSTVFDSGKYRHHIAPRCEFPELEDEPDNIIRLSYKNHVRVHVLLSKAVPEHAGFRHTMLMMTGQTELAQTEAAARGRAAQGGAEGLRALLLKANAAQSPKERLANLAKARAAQSPEERRAAGEKGNAVNAAAGYTNLTKARAVQGYEGLCAAAAKGRAILGPKGLRAAREKGLAALSPEELRAASAKGIAAAAAGGWRGCRKGRHMRWHAACGVVSPTCEFCT